MKQKYMQEFSSMADLQAREAQNFTFPKEGEKKDENVNVNGYRDIDPADINPVNPDSNEQGPAAREVIQMQANNIATSTEAPKTSGFATREFGSLEEFDKETSIENNLKFLEGNNLDRSNIDYMVRSIDSMKSNFLDEPVDKDGNPMVDSEGNPIVTWKSNADVTKYGEKFYELYNAIHATDAKFKAEEEQIRRTMKTEEEATAFENQE